VLSTSKTRNRCSRVGIYDECLSPALYSYGACKPSAPAPSHCRPGWVCDIHQTADTGEVRGGRWIGCQPSPARREAAEPHISVQSSSKDQAHEDADDEGDDSRKLALNDFDELSKLGYHQDELVQGAAMLNVAHCSRSDRRSGVSSGHTSDSSDGSTVSTGRSVDRSVRPRSTWLAHHDLPVAGQTKS
jgi:hypothetical protein